MNENNSISRSTPLSAVSFETKNRVTPQINLVVGLIKKCVAEQRPITTNDIINIYVEWRQKHRWDNKFYTKTWQGWSGPTYVGKYHYTQITADEYKNEEDARHLSRIWFKNNLAAAVIKGKLLVLPIIDLDDDCDMPNKAK
jgi:hypothetical protein